MFREKSCDPHLWDQCVVDLAIHVQVAAYATRSSKHSLCVFVCMFPSVCFQLLSLSSLTSLSVSLSPMLVIRFLNSAVVMVPVPLLSSTRKADRMRSSSLMVFIFSAIMLQNSGNSIKPEPSVSNCKKSPIFIAAQRQLLPVFYTSGIQG